MRPPTAVQENGRILSERACPHFTHKREFGGGRVLTQLPPCSHLPVIWGFRSPSSLGLARGPSVLGRRDGRTLAF